MLIYSFITDYQAFNLRYKDNTTRDKNETKVDKQSANLGKNNEPIQNRLSFLIDCKSVILHHLAILSFPMVRPAWDNWWMAKARGGTGRHEATCHPRLGGACEAMALRRESRRGSPVPPWLAGSNKSRRVQQGQTGSRECCPGSPEATRADVCSKSRRGAVEGRGRQSLFNSGMSTGRGRVSPIR